MDTANPYRGRFAPSPTGPLHFGSLLSALASFLEARSRAGVWLVRMEDLDPPREQPGADQLILHSLQQHGLHWDEELLYQSRRHEAYEQALAALLGMEAAYSCDCSRRELRPFQGVYPGICRERGLKHSENTAVRVRTDQQTITFTDQFQARQAFNLEREAGDFIIRRRDQLFAYQLAVSVDDHFQNISHIVRGIDLLDSTPRQIHLQRLLGYVTPAYGHLPILVDASGEKLSKQAAAPALVDSNACDNLVRALNWLGQTAPPIAAQHSVQGILDFAISHYSSQAIPQSRRIILPELAGRVL